MLCVTTNIRSSRRNRFLANNLSCTSFGPIYASLDTHDSLEFRPRTNEDCFGILVRGQAGLARLWSREFYGPLAVA